MTYEAIISTPRQEPTHEREYMDLIEDMTQFGYIDSTMGTHGYTFEFWVSREMSIEQLDSAIRDIVNYYGLVLRDLYEIGY